MSRTPIDQDEYDERARQELRDEGAAALREKRDELRQRIPEIEEQAEEARKDVIPWLLSALSVAYPDEPRETLLTQAKFSAHSGSETEPVQAALSHMKQRGGYYRDRAQEIEPMLERRKALREQHHVMQARFAALQRVLYEWTMEQLEQAEEQAEETADQTAIERTVRIGQALIDHREEHGRLPHFGGGKNNAFLEWAGDTIDTSASTARRALEATGCLTAKRQGADGSDLQQRIQRVVEYARQHRISIIS